MSHRSVLAGLAALLAALSPLVAAAGQPTLPAINTNNIIVVTNAPYKAKNDGTTDNTLAISNAIVAAAKGGLTNGLYGGTVQIPAPGVYLCGPLNLSNYVNLQIDAGAVLRMLPYGQYPGNNNSRPNFISASGLHDIQLSGAGAVDGQGAPWWDLSETNSSAKRPNMVNLSSCSKVLIQNMTLSNSPSPFIAIKGNNAGNVTIQGITVKAPPSSGVPNPSHNTDAIDLAETNALIQNCSISTGDDNLAIGSSAGLSCDILVTNCFFGDGHGCSIGSYTSSGVSNLTVINCSFSGTDNGIRLKSQRDRGGVVQNCNYYNLRMTNVDWPFLIYSYYEYGLGTLTGVDPVFAATTAATNPTILIATTPIWRNITFSNITATVPNGRPPLMVWGLPEAPASNIVFRSVSITSSSTKSPGVYNATNLQFIDCSFSLPSGVETVQFWNAGLTFTNTSLQTNLLLLDGLTTNGIGNSLSFYNAQASVQNTNAIDDGPLTLSGSILTVSNNLSLYPSSVLNFGLGTNNTRVAVMGNLTLGGTNRISAAPGFANGTYTLITCTGTLRGNPPVLSSVPPPYSYRLDTNTAGQVKLVVTLPAPANLVASATNLLINLKWNAVAGADTYNLKRGTTSNGPYPTVFSGLTKTNCADANVTNAVNYFYVVTAVGAGGESSNSLQVATAPLPSNLPARIATQFANSQLQLSWPQDHLGWRLECQTNGPGLGLGSAWWTVGSSMATNLMLFPIHTTNGSVFFRLVYP